MISPPRVFQTRNGIRTLNQLTETQKAYVAGIIDGEGCISLSKKKDSTIRGGLGYRPFVTVSNTNINLLEWLTTTVGLGAAIKHSQPDVDKATNRKRRYSWGLWSQQAGAFLEEIRPYLILKANQADIIIEFTKTTRRQTGGRAGLSIEQWKYRTDTYEAMKRLNKRGLR